jgi:hypothetical protein
MPETTVEQSKNPAGVPPRKSGIVLAIAGRYTLTRKLDSQGKPREFHCRIVGISSHEMRLEGPVKGALRERVVTNCKEFGTLEGVVDRFAERGFILRLTASKEERAKLAAKIDWQLQSRNKGASENRGDRRIIPSNPHSSIILADGSRVQCFVIDMSVSGAAVSAELDIEAGTPLSVGAVVGRVVRKIPAGFAVKFIERQDINFLEKLIIRPLAE